MHLPFTKHSIQEKFKGWWLGPDHPKPAKGPVKFNPGQYNWTQRCIHYDKLLAENSMAKSCAWGLAGRILQNGLFLEPADKYDRAVKAKEACEDLNNSIGIKSLLYSTIPTFAAHGSYYWEISTTPAFNVRAVPQQEYLEPSEADNQGEIVKWKYGYAAGTTAEWPRSEMVIFDWMVTSQSYPHGTSLFTGCETELEILEQLEIDIKAHMHNTAFPQTAIGAGDANFHPNIEDVEAIRSSVRNWAPGEVQVTNYPLSSVTLTGGQPIRDLESVLQFCKDNIIDSFMVSPISKLYNSTYASSKEMQETENARLISPMQTLIAHILEEQLYKPYLEWLGFSVVTCPHVKWTSADANRIELGAYWAQQVQSGIVPKRYAQEQQGFDVDKIAEYEAAEQQAMMEQQIALQALQPKQEPNQPQQTAKEYEEWVVRKRLKS